MTPTAVVTSIQGPTPSMRILAARAASDAFSLLVVGDRKSPQVYGLESTQFISIEQQRELQFELAALLPENHYSRKNLGYLVAIASSAPAIFDTDDDNEPLPGWRVRTETVLASNVGNTGWVNAYRQFSNSHVWPRGFPLEHLRHAFEPLELLPASIVSSPVQQSVVNGSPDVDAIWRLVEDRDFEFALATSIHLAMGRWCPFNSQSTWWFPAAYPLLYLPSFVSFRMTDIWRSFIAQRCLWEMGVGVVFHGPEMFQSRNPHNLLVDFEQEVPGYLNNARICRLLEEVQLSAGHASVADNLRNCYETLIRAGLVAERELELVGAWIRDVTASRNLDHPVVEPANQPDP